MEKYPLNMVDFIDMFPSEEACMEYLALVRWRDGHVCSRCGCCDAWKMGRGLYRCKECRHSYSVISGTIFQDTHKPLRLWFQAIWYVVNQKNGVSALGLQKALGLGSYHTAWEWLHKLRRAMVRPNRDKLSGVVEVDETFVGGVREGKRGRGAEGKTLVFIAVESVQGQMGRIRLKTIPNATGESLLQATQSTIKQGSTVCSDGWDAYNILTQNGYIHQPTTHANAPSGDATTLAHHVAALFKRWWLGTHQGAISTEHLEYYLDEFTFRFNRRNSKSRGKLFYRLIEQALQIEPKPAKVLYTTSSG